MNIGIFFCQHEHIYLTIARKRYIILPEATFVVTKKPIRRFEAKKPIPFSYSQYSKDSTRSQARNGFGAKTPARAEEGKKKKWRYGDDRRKGKAEEGRMPGAWDSRRLKSRAVALEPALTDEHEKAGGIATVRTVKNIEESPDGLNALRANESITIGGSAVDEDGRDYDRTRND